ncbi:MAG: ABC transporter permease [Clostridium sp.]|nr:ABC transporter permease [Clostridium sp.]
MKKTITLTKLSFLYWKTHIKRIMALAAVCILGAAALCFSCLYIRSEKAFVMENMLTLHGDYDAVLYGIEEADIPLVSENDAVTSYGFYRELGYVGMEGTPQYKVASFPDEKSAQMYHMTCIQGNYPQNEKEVAMDADTAKKLGIVPMAGQNITLTLYDLAQQKLEEREYMVSGIFEASSADVYGGFYRYPHAAIEYDVPAIFVSDRERSLFDSTLITVFIQAETEIYQLETQMAQAGFQKLTCFDIPPGRSQAYSNILGISGHISNAYGELNVSNLLLAIRDGNVCKDFYSAVLIPLFAGFILVIVTISVFSLVRDIIIGRAREIAILRSIGMTKQGTFLYLFAELAILITLFLITGMITGNGFHYLLVRGMNALNGTDIPLGFHVNAYVASVTPQPWLYAAMVIGASSVSAILVPLLKMSQSAPISVFRMKYHEKKNLSERHFSDFSKCTWKTLISRHIKFHERPVLIIMCIIMCAAFFGYNYFRAFTDKENREYSNELTANGLKDWDFTAKKNNMSYPYTFLIENHHDYGIGADAYNRFADKEFVEASFARMVNKSTRLVYPKDAAPEAVMELMSPFYLREYEAYAASENAYERTEYEAEQAMLEQIGYHTDENIYALPTIGMPTEEFAALSPYIKDGEINMEKMKSGEEVLLVVPANMEAVTAEAFHAGNTVPLSDIVLSAEEENYSFSSISPFECTEPAYLNYVEDPSFGVIVRYASFAFGTRKDFNTKIGAVVVLNEEEHYQKYLLPCSELNGLGKDSDTVYAPCILCLPDTFANWGLPDRLFTEVKFRVTDSEKLSTANALFYETIGSCSGLTFASSFEIKEKMKTNAGNTMTIYYIMILTLIFLGMIAVGIKFYSRIKLNSQTIARLRAIGMSLPQIESLILRQNILYPLIGGVLSLIPTFLCQMLFDYIKRQIDSGIWSGITVITNGGGGIPWYHNVPFRYNLFGYHPVLVLLAIVLIFEILMLLATIPQILYMRKQRLAEMIDMDSF